MKDRSVSVRDMMIIIIISCVLSVTSTLGIIDRFDSIRGTDHAETVYKSKVKDYNDCIIRQINTKGAIDRSAATRGFMQVVIDEEQNYGAALKELSYQQRITDPIYTSCVKPQVPSDIKEIKLPKAPYNNLVKP